MSNVTKLGKPEERTTIVHHQSQDQAEFWVACAPGTIAEYGVHRWMKVGPNLWITPKSYYSEIPFDRVTDLAMTQRILKFGHPIRVLAPVSAEPLDLGFRFQDVPIEGSLTARLFGQDPI